MEKKLGFAPGVTMEIKFPDKKYQIILADPPYEYTNSGSTKNSRGNAKQFYKTMPINEIKNLLVNDIADQNCFLFLWTTYPQLQNGLDVVKAWGFNFKTVAFTWIKKTVNMNDFVGELGLATLLLFTLITTFCFDLIDFITRTTS